MKLFRIVSLIALLASALPAFAWNAIGHKVVCEIAWQELSDSQRTEIVDVLKRHPRFGEDFLPDMPPDDQDHWIFLHAGTWPDIARGIRGPDRDKFDKPIWHYVNFPLTIDGFPAPQLNLGSDPAKHKSVSWNVLQATNYCRGVVDSDASPTQRALAYSWLFHLVGDIHQPLHSTALFCERFPKGDRGGNSIKLVKGDNLHSLWDNLLGRSHTTNAVKRVVADLRNDKSLWRVKTSGRVEDWVSESHETAKSFSYDRNLLDQIRDPANPGPFTLPPTYYPAAGRVARASAVAGGLRLAALLRAEGRDQASDSDRSFDVSPEPFAPAREPERIERFSSASEGQPQLTHWLNTKSNVRHNATCDHYRKTKNGRPCGPDEGKPCGICGG